MASVRKRRLYPKAKLPIVLQNNAVRSNSVDLGFYYYHLLFEQTNSVAYNLAKNRFAREQWIAKNRPLIVDKEVWNELMQSYLEGSYSVDIKFEA